MTLTKAIGILSVFLIPAITIAQTFNSGSTGADGALTYATPGTFVFDPKSFSPPLDPDGDCIFNFTTITIAAGVTVQLKGNVLDCPVVWLASGAVKIDGTLDLSGQSTFQATNNTQRVYSIPGSGGFGGGYPSANGLPAGAGLGPAGGAIYNCNGGESSSGGGFTGNQYLVPLIGGSGGGGFSVLAGGAGGGAILIASSTSISGAGSINASGGQNLPNPAASGGGGGAIRLVAPQVTFTGPLNASRGSNGCNAASGVVRIEGFSINVTGSISGNYYTASPFGLFVSPGSTPLLNITSVGGNPVPPNPSGSFATVDVTVSSSGPMTFGIQATNIPLGTTATLMITSENGPDQTIVSTPLSGTLASSTATATATLPSGFSRGIITATW
jgi:hypothetical protein